MTANKEEVVALVKSLLISDPEIMTAMRDFMHNHPAPVAVPGFGDIEPSSAKFNEDGSYILPNQIPPTHQMGSVHELPLETLVQVLPLYNDLVKKIAELKAYQETAAAKTQIVKNLERGIAVHQTWLNQHPEPQAKAAATTLAAKYDETIGKLDSISFKSVRDKISGKSKEIKQREQEEQENINAERIVRTKSLQEQKAKLEKARIGAQLANSDCSGLAGAQKELLDLLEKILGSLDNDDTAFLLSALKESNNIAAKVSADLKAFQAAVSVATTMDERLLVALKAIIAQQNNYGKSLLFPEQEKIVAARNKGMDTAEQSYLKIQEEAEILGKLVPSLKTALPAFRLKVPDLFLEHVFPNYPGGGHVDTRFDEFQNFVMIKNAAICKEHKVKLQTILAGLKQSLDSISSVYSLVRADLDEKNMELNVYRMECVEVMAAKESGRPRLDRADMRRLLMPGVDHMVLSSSS
ncbi:hypothetical protein HDU97_002688 [Phlyctochytrium planicorne]|nr:hypothetical protein HDU97_002688 [Phlyctochytrium planicorne]